jgi:hypothetical protein
MNRIAMALLVALAGLSAGCRQGADDPGRELQRLRGEMIAKQELLYRIHLDLDAAATEVLAARQAARDGNVSGADYHTSEAYRVLNRADDLVLGLGRDLQVLFELDRLGADP